MKHNRCRCSGKIKKSRTLTDEGYIVECMKCDKCSEVSFTTEQAKMMIKLREADKKIASTRKIIKVGDSIANLLPKQIKELGIKEGMTDSVNVLSDNSIELKFNKKII